MANNHDCLENLFTDIADAIREKRGVTDKICADNFPSNIRAIPTGGGSGGITPTGTKTITANGTHDVTNYAYAQVNVPTTGGDVVYGEDIEVGSLAELHAWNKYAIGGTVTETKVDTLYISGDQTGSDSIYEPLDYADSYDTSTGKIVLVNPTENVTFTSSTNAQILLGKYIQTYETPHQYAAAASPSGKFYRIDSTADFEYDKTTYPSTGRSLRVSPAYRLNYAGSEDQFIGIVVSEDSNAYPQNGTQDGYKYVYNGTLNDAGGCNHVAVTQAVPSITVSESGLITATSEQDGGLVAAGTKTTTHQLPTQGGVAVKPGTNTRIAVAAGKYTTADVTVIGDSQLVGSNIRSGVSIFGVAGTYEGGTALPTLDPAGTADDLASGKQLIGADGEVVTGKVETTHPTVATAKEATEVIRKSLTGTPFIFMNRSFDESLLVRAGDTLGFYSDANNFGDASADDVVKGKTFTSANGLKVTGTVETYDEQVGWKNRIPTLDGDSTVKLSIATNVPYLLRKGFFLSSPLSNFGDATASDVAKGKTFTSAAGLTVVGTNTFRDIKTITIEEV